MTLKTTKIEDEAKFVVLYSTTQPDEYQPLEKWTQDLLPIRYVRVTADRVKCLHGSAIYTTWVILTRQVFFNFRFPVFLKFQFLQKAPKIDFPKSSIQLIS